MKAEVDVHFPQLTVGQTLEFAARARGIRFSQEDDYRFVDNVLQHLAIEFQVYRASSMHATCEM